MVQHLTLVLLVLLTAETCRSDLGLQSKKQYEFFYEGVQRTGLPKMAAQYASVGIRCDVKVKVEEANMFFFKLDNVRHGETHARKDPETPWSQQINYQNVVNNKKELERTFKVQTQNGKVMSISTHQGEPTWVVNLKKSVVQLFQVNLQGADTRGVSQNSPSLLTSINPNSVHGPRMFRVMEDGIQGKCESVYEIIPSTSPTQHNPMQLKSKELYLNFNVQMPEHPERPFTVYKTRNYKQCENEWVGKNTRKCEVDGDCNDDQPQISTQHQYLMDGDESSFTIREVSVFSDVLYHPDNQQAQSEVIQTTSQQTLLYKHSFNTKQHSTFPKQAQEHTDLKFQMPITAGANPLWNAPRSPTEMLFAPQSTAPGKVQCVKDVIDVLDSQLNGFTESHKEDVASLVIKAEECATFLSYPNIQSIISHIQSPTQLEILNDILAMTGTYPALMVLLQQIKRGQISDSQASSIISQLPQQMQSPIPQLIQQLLNLLKEKRIQDKQQIYATLCLSLGNIFGRWCADDGEQTPNTDGSSLEWNQCNGRMEALMDEFVIRMMQEARRKPEPENLVAIQSIGNVGHIKVLSPLRQLITAGKSRQTVVKAVYALRKITRNHPEEVADTVQPIALETTQPREVRQAAVTVLLSTNPKIYVWTRLATSLRREPSKHVASFVYGALKAYASTTDQSKSSMKHKAQRSLLFIRDAPNSMGYNTIYNIKSSVLKDIFPEMKGTASFVVGSTYPITETLYLCFKYLAGGKNDEFSRLVIDTKGFNQILNDLTTQWRNGKLKQVRPERLLNQLPTTFRKVVEQLGMRHRLQSRISPEISIYTSLFDKVDRMFQMNSRDYDAFKSWIENGGSVKYHPTQRIVYNTAKTTVLPSEIGLPTVFTQKTPMVVSARGDVELSLDFFSGKYSVALTNMSPTFSKHTRTSIRINSPFSGNVLEAGIDETVQVSVPLSAKLSVSTQTQEIETTVELKNSCSPTRDHACQRLLHTHRIPYTKLSSDQQCHTMFQCSVSSGSQQSMTQSNTHHKEPVQSVTDISYKSTTIGDHLTNDLIEKIYTTSEEQYYHSDVFFTANDHTEPPSKLQTTLTWMDTRSSIPNHQEMSSTAHTRSVQLQKRKMKRMHAEMTHQSNEDDWWGVAVIQTSTKDNTEKLDFSGSVCYTLHKQDRERTREKMWVETHGKTVCLQADTVSQKPMNPFSPERPYRKHISASYGIGSDKCESETTVFSIEMQSAKSQENCRGITCNSGSQGDDYEYYSYEGEEEENYYEDYYERVGDDTGDHTSQEQTPEQCMDEKRTGEPLSDKCSQLQKKLSLMKSIKFKLHDQSNPVVQSIAHQLRSFNVQNLHNSDYQVQSSTRPTDTCEVQVDLTYGKRQVQANIQMITPEGKLSLSRPDVMDSESANQVLAMYTTDEEENGGSSFGSLYDHCTLGTKWLQTLDGERMRVPETFVEEQTGGRGGVRMETGETTAEGGDRSAGCSVVLAQCIGCAQRFVVTASGDSRSRQVTVATAHREVTLVKRRPQLDSTNFALEPTQPVDIYVDNEPRPVYGTQDVRLQDKPVSDDDSEQQGAITISVRDGHVSVKLPREAVRVRLDSENGQVRLSVDQLLYSNCNGARGCGVCGKMDGEWTDADGCVHTSSQTLWASYRMAPSVSQHGRVANRMGGDNVRGGTNQCEPVRLMASQCTRQYQVVNSAQVRP